MPPRSDALAPLSGAVAFGLLLLALAGCQTAPTANAVAPANSAATDTYQPARYANLGHLAAVDFATATAVVDTRRAADPRASTPPAGTPVVIRDQTLQITGRATVSEFRRPGVIGLYLAGGKPSIGDDVVVEQLTATP